MSDLVSFRVRNAVAAQFVRSSQLMPSGKVLPQGLDHSRIQVDRAELVELCAWLAAQA